MSRVPMLLALAAAFGLGQDAPHLTSTAIPTLKRTKGTIVPKGHRIYFFTVNQEFQAQELVEVDMKDKMFVKYSFQPLTIEFVTDVLEKAKLAGYDLIVFSALNLKNAQIKATKLFKENIANKFGQTNNSKLNEFVFETSQNSRSPLNSRKNKLTEGKLFLDGKITLDEITSRSVREYVKQMQKFLC